MLASVRKSKGIDLLTSTDDGSALSTYNNAVATLNHANDVPYLASNLPDNLNPTKTGYNDWYQSLSAFYDDYKLAETMYKYFSGFTGSNAYSNYQSYNRSKTILESFGVNFDDLLNSSQTAYVALNNNGTKIDAAQQAVDDAIASMADVVYEYMISGT